MFRSWLCFVLFLGDGFCISHVFVQSHSSRRPRPQIRVMHWNLHIQDQIMKRQIVDLCWLRTPTMTNRIPKMPVNKCLTPSVCRMNVCVLADNYNDALANFLYLKRCHGLTDFHVFTKYTYLNLIKSLRTCKAQSQGTKTWGHGRWGARHIDTGVGEPRHRAFSNHHNLPLP